MSPAPRTVENRTMKTPWQIAFEKLPEYIGDSDTSDGFDHDDMRSFAVAVIEADRAQRADGLKSDARLHGVAVLAVGRSDFERYLDRPLTEEEWGRVAAQNSDLDAWVGDNTVHSFIGAVLSDAGIPNQKEDA